MNRNDKKFDNKYLESIHRTVSECKKEGLIPKKLVVSPLVYESIRKETIFFDCRTKKLFGIQVEKDNYSDFLFTLFSVNERKWRSKDKIF